MISNIRWHLLPPPPRPHPLTTRLPLLQESSGIGYEISLMLARNGFLTYATMRNLNKSENIKLAAAKENLPIRINQCDVADDVSVKNAVQAYYLKQGE